MEEQPAIRSGKVEAVSGSASHRVIDSRAAQLFRTNPLAIVISSAIDGKILDVNDAFVHMLGYERDRLIGVSPGDLGMLVDPQEWAEAVTHAGMGQSPQAIETRIKTALGTTRTISATVYAENFDGIPVLLFYLQDITDRRQTEFRLRLIDRIARIGYESRSFDHVLKSSLDAIHEAYPMLRVGFGAIEGSELVAVYAAGPEHMPSLLGVRTDLTVIPGYAAALSAGTPLVISDTSKDDLFEPIRSMVAEANVGATMSIPVQRGTQTVGLLFLHSATPVEWTQHEIDTAVEVAALLAVSLFRARAEEELQRERELMQTVMDYAPDFLYIKDAELRFTRVNRALAVYHGFSDPRDIIGKSDFDLFPSALAERYVIEENRLLASGEPLFNLLEPLDAAETQWNLTTKVPIKDDAGRVTGMVGTCRNVSAVNAMEDALRESERRQRALLEAIPDMVFNFDDEGVILDARANRGIASWIDPTSRIGRTLFDVVPPAAQLILDGIRRSLESKIVVSVEYEIERNQSLLTFEMRIAPSGDHEVVAVSRDVTDRKSLEKRLAHQATHDPVTGLPNRRLFAERLNHALELARNDNTSVAVLFVDLNNFKQVNDTFGHSAGDRLLSAIGDRLQRCVRSGDTVARIGGDEFAVLLECLPLGPELDAITNRIANHVARPVRIGSQSAQTSASIGIAIGIPDRDTAESILDEADHAMYEAKRSGRPLGGSGGSADLLTNPRVDAPAFEHSARTGSPRGSIRRFPGYVKPRPKPRDAIDHPGQPRAASGAE